MRIAVCDDDPNDLEELAGALSDYLRTHAQKATVTRFTRAEALLAEARKTPFDLYLLDVMLGGETGVEVVRQLRGHGPAVPVVFFSTNHGYAYDAFGVEAIGYVGKPWTMETFTAQLDKALAVVGAQARQYLAFGTEGNTRRFRGTDIVYVGAADSANYVRIHLVDGTTVDARFSLRAFADACREQIELLPIGRALLVNPRQISGLSGHKVTFFTGEKFAIPSRTFTSVREAILKSF